MLPQVVDVTAITGQRAVGPLTSWQTPDGPYNVEHLAGMSLDGEILVFYWSPRHDWQVVNVSQITGQRVASPLTSWQTPDGSYNVEHLAGINVQGEVLVFYWSPRHDWQVVNVSHITGQRVSSSLTSWQAPDGPYNVEHLAGVSSNGDVLVFYWSPRHDWQVVNVSHITGQRATSSLTSWQTPDGPYNVEHLAGINGQGEVLVFYRSSRHDWQVVNVSQITGQRVASPLTSWQTPDGPYNVEHLAGVSSNGELFVFYWSPRHDWQVVDVSQIADQRAVSPFTSWQTRHGSQNVEHLGGISSQDEVLVFFWSPHHDWQVINFSQITGQYIASPLTSWQTPDGPYNIEHLAGVNPAGEVLVFYWSMLDTSNALGTWYVNANYQGNNNFLLLVSITGSSTRGIYQGTLVNENGVLEILDNISFEVPTRLLQFRRNGQGFWQWYRSTIVEGVLVGRFSHSTNSSQKPSQLTAFAYHVTGWNSNYLDQDIVPRAYDLVINSNFLAKLRIDRTSDGQHVGRLKVYDWPSGEEPEYDLEVTQWDGTHLSFIRRSPNWTQVYTGVVSGRTISGTFTQSGIPAPAPWQGSRAEVLGYGLVRKSHRERAEWQDRTRHQLHHLMMAENPMPVTRTVTQQEIQVSPSPGGLHRDDNPNAWPQDYQLTELHFDYSLPNPYGGPAIARQSHAYLAIPKSLPASGKYRAVLALNGHDGSAWQVMNPDQGGIYWYGNAFARRGYMVLALDISHRPLEDRALLYTNYTSGDDPAHGNGSHPAIKATGFNSDWEEDGERAWDAMRALDYLLSLPNVDARSVLVTGLSMGGEITTITAALDPRLAMCIPAGFSPDLDVVQYHGNHPCWRWQNANAREYIDTSDLHALISPRPLIVETGKQDTIFSSFSAPFASDKQVARRSRIAFGDGVENFVHYLHYDFHNYHVGDFDPLDPNAERGVRVPTITAPQAPWSLAWQTDPTTLEVKSTLFDYIDFLLQ